jgi:hypothetical protein
MSDSALALTSRGGFAIGDNGGMDSVPKKAPSPWLGPVLTIVAILVAVLWAYIQMRHWKEPEADYVAIGAGIAVTLALWAILIWAAIRNLKGARRSKALHAQNAALTDELRTRRMHFESKLSEQTKMFNDKQRQLLQTVEENKELRVRERDATTEVNRLKTALELNKRCPVSQNEPEQRSVRSTVLSRFSTKLRELGAPVQQMGMPVETPGGITVRLAQ